MTADHVLIVGAGFGGLDVAIRVRRVRPGTPVTLVNPTGHLVYRPWLIFLPARQREPSDLRVPLAGVARRAGVTVRVDTVTSLDPGGTAHLASGERISFTQAVVATGARSDPSRFPGTAEHAYLPCDVDEATRFTEAFQGLGSGHVTVVIAGERPGPGLEYAGWLARAVERSTHARDVRIRMIDEGGRLAAVLGPRAFARVASHLTRLGHEVVPDATVREIGTDRVRLGDGRCLRSDLTAVVGPLRGQDVGLPPDAVDERGFVMVDRNLRSPAFPALFALGDAAALPEGWNLPKTMLMARRQAGAVAGNVARALDGRDPDPFDVASARRSVFAMPDFGGRTVFVRNRRLIASGRWPLVLRSMIDRSFFRSHNYGN